MPGMFTDFSKTPRQQGLGIGQVSRFSGNPPIGFFPPDRACGQFHVREELGTLAAELGCVRAPGSTSRSLSLVLLQPPAFLPRASFHSRVAC